MALAIDRGKDHVRVLSELSDRVVHALLGDGENGSSSGDAFSIALRRYRDNGDPGELEPEWRRIASGSASLADASAAKVLRLLARDLLEVVASSESEVGAAAEEPAEGAPPANVHPIDAAPASVPALEQASDGTWRPSAGAVVASADADAAQRRQAAFVPSLTSRYPTRRASGPVVDLPLPPDVLSEALPAERAAQRPIARVTPPPVREGIVHPSATPSADTSRPTSASITRSEPDSLIHAVSGGTEVVAGPFTRFQDLAAFAKALRDIPGVQSVTTRQFVRGTVHVRVRHSQGVDLADALLALTDFRPSILSSAAGKIEIAVELPDLPPADA